MTFKTVFLSQGAVGRRLACLGRRTGVGLQDLKTQFESYAESQVGDRNGEFLIFAALIGATFLV